MHRAVSVKALKEDEVAQLSQPELVSIVLSQGQTIEALEQRLDWLTRQVFGTKSERLRVLENPQQLALEDILAPPEQEMPAKESTVAAHTRREARRDAAKVADAESIPFFDEKRVPVQTIELAHPEMQGLSTGDYEVIGEKVSYRLAQRPGSYVVLKYVRPVIKRLDTQVISAAPAPQGVLEGSRADVSFLAGLLQDKFDYHLPLNRQHRRLYDNGIDVSRPWLTQLTQRSVSLLEPIYDAQFDSVLASRVKAMDETTIKGGAVGRAGCTPATSGPSTANTTRSASPSVHLAQGRTCVQFSGRSTPPGRCC